MLFRKMLITLVVGSTLTGCASLTTPVPDRARVRVADTFTCQPPKSLPDGATMGDLLSVAVDTKSRLVDCTATLNRLKAAVSPMVEFY